MFYYLNGKLTYVDTNICVVECAGVGYKLTVSLTTSNALSSKLDQNVKIFTHLAVREDGIELFGFSSNEERSAFNMLIGVSGVGPKAAINILSIMTADKLAMAVCTEDVKSISKAQNIGAKTAARIVLELKDKVAKDMVPMTRSGSGTSATQGTLALNTGNLAEAAEALLVLGYDKNSVSRALAGISPETEVGNIIKSALKKLS